jgi:release factor glutamine methyltransferase
MTTTAKQEDWTVGRLLTWTDQFFAQKGSRSPRLDAELLLAHALQCSRMEIYTRYHDVAGEEERQRFRELVRKRSEGCPVAYLVGRKEFYSLSLEVNPAVLIPRPATETLVMECLKLARDITAPRILDIGTGSGNIAIAVARNKPDAPVTATDISPESLEVARRNASANKVAERIRFLQGDLFQPISQGERFQFIVSNPPYVSDDEWNRLEVNVRDYEPRSALQAGAEGLDIIERLIREAPPFLEPGSYLMFEIAPGQEEAVRRLLESVQGLKAGNTFLDGDALPRVAWARWVTGERGA